MNTERMSLRAAASPATADTTSTGIPSGVSAAAKGSAPLPDASAGVCSPRAGTGPSKATSANAASSASSDASSRFKPGEAVFRSAKTDPDRSAGRAAPATARATAALFTLRTMSQPATAVSGSAVRVMPAGSEGDTGS